MTALSLVVTMFMRLTNAQADSLTYLLAVLALGIGVADAIFSQTIFKLEPGARSISARLRCPDCRQPMELEARLDESSHDPIIWCSCSRCGVERRWEGLGGETP